MALITNLDGQTALTSFTLESVGNNSFFRPVDVPVNDNSPQSHSLSRLFECKGGYFRDRITGLRDSAGLLFQKAAGVNNIMTEHGPARYAARNSATGALQFSHNTASGILTSGTSISLWMYLPTNQYNASANTLTSRFICGDALAVVTLRTNASALWRVLPSSIGSEQILTYGPTAEEWFNVTLTYQAIANTSGVCNLYIDSVLASSGILYTRPPANDLIDFVVGGGFTCPEVRLLELRTYSKVLTQNEVNNLYNTATRWDLYSEPKTWFAPSTTTNPPFTLYMSGSAALLNNNTTLFTQGQDIGSGGIPLFVKMNEEANSGVSLFTHGKTFDYTFMDLSEWGHTAGDFRRFTLAPIRMRRTNWGRRPVPENILDDNRSFHGVWDFGGLSWDKVFDRSRRQNHLTTSVNNLINWTTDLYPNACNTATSEKLQKKVRKNTTATKFISTYDFKTSSTKAFTISAWVYFDSYARSSIFGNYVDSSNNGFFLNQQVDGTLQFLSLQSSTKYYTINFPVVPLRQWVNITLTYDGNQATTDYQNGVNIYYNGELQTATTRTRTGSPDSAEYGAKFYLGRTVFSAFDTYNAFTGLLSSCLVSNKLMSHIEIRKLAYDYYFNSPFIQTYTAGLVLEDENNGQDRLSLYVSGTQLFSNNNITLFLKNTINFFDGTTTQTSIYRQRRQNWQGKASPVQIKSNRQDVVGIWRSEDGDKERLEDYSNNNNYLAPHQVDDFEYNWATDVSNVVLDDGRKIEKPVITMAGNSALRSVDSGVYQYSVNDKFTFNLWGNYNLQDFNSFFGTINNYITLEGYSLVTFPNSVLFLMGNTDTNYAYVEFNRPPNNRYNMITLRYGGAREVDTYGPVSGAIYGIDLFYNGIQQTPVQRVFNGTFDNWKTGDAPFYVGKGSSIGLDSVNGQFSSLTAFDRDLSDREISNLYQDFYLNTFFQQSHNIPFSYDVPKTLSLFVKAPEPSNDNFPLFVQVPEPSNSGLPLFVEGGRNNGNIPLFIYSNQNRNLTLFLSADLGSGSVYMPMFVKVREPDELINSFPLITYGFSPSGPGTSQISSFQPTLFTSGSIRNPTASMNLFLPGHSIGYPTSYMNLYTGAHAPSLANSVNLAVYNNETINSTTLFVQGLSTSSSSDGVPSAGTEYTTGMNLFISRNSPAATTLFICNNLVDSGNVPLYMFGAFFETDSVPLSIPATLGFDTKTIKLYTHGY